MQSRILSCLLMLEFKNLSLHYFLIRNVSSMHILISGRRRSTHTRAFSKYSQMHAIMELRSSSNYFSKCTLFVLTILKDSWASWTTYFLLLKYYLALARESSLTFSVFQALWTTSLASINGFFLGDQGLLNVAEGILFSTISLTT